MSLVTVIVPTYDRRSYLLQALQSIKAQSFSDYKVLIADDASPEDASEVVSGLQDPRFEIQRRHSNVGMAANIWPALANATSKYVCTLHDDDLWEPDFLKLLVGALEEFPAASVAFCDFWHIDAEGSLLDEETIVSSRDFGRAALHDGFYPSFIYQGVWQRAIPAAMGAVFRHSAIAWAYFPSEVGTAYDEWLAYLAVRKGGVWYTSQKLSRYRIHQASESAHWGPSKETRFRHRAQEEFLTRLKADDPLVLECRPNLVRRNRRALLGLVIAASLIKRARFARNRIADAKHLHPAWLKVGLRLLSYLPARLAQLALKIKAAFA